MATARERARIVYGGSTTSGMDSLGVGGTAGGASSPFRFGGSGMFNAGGASIGGESTPMADAAGAVTNNYYGADSRGSSYMGNSTFSGGGYSGGYSGYSGAISRPSGNNAGFQGQTLPEGWSTRPSSTVKPTVAGVNTLNAIQRPRPTAFNPYSGTGNGAPSHSPQTTLTSSGGDKSGQVGGGRTMDLGRNSDGRHLNGSTGGSLNVRPASSYVGSQINADGLDLGATSSGGRRL